MAFRACHGCYRQEQLTGNDFAVDIEMDYDMEKAAASDDLADALDYAEVYELVKREMNIRSQLLEHLCSRILDRIFDQYPQLREATVRVEKLNPPVEGPMKSVSVRMRRSCEIPY